MKRPSPHPTINFQRHTAAITTMRLQATYHGQVVADCNLCEPDGHNQALRLLALNPILHRLTNWLVRQNEDRAKRDIILRGALLVATGAVEAVDRHHSIWETGDFGTDAIQQLHGRIRGIRYNHLITGWQPSDWSCQCVNAPWLPLPVNRLPISGIKKTDSCRHELAWWLAGHLLKRTSAQRQADNQGYYRIIPTAKILSLIDNPVDEAHGYQVWRIPGRTRQNEYQPVTYCLVRPFGDGTAGVVVKSINPGWQWRQGIAALLNLAKELNQEAAWSNHATTNKGNKHHGKQKPAIHSDNFAVNKPGWLPG